ncbi:MAG: hypothetical protein HC809_13890 [Gammaproteobacteria bacterium]|nr:hypothetical protein [Gammaproteobacteria bacterium]
MVLGRHHKGGEDIEDNFVDCVSDNLNGGSKKLAVIREDAFVDALFPWFEPRTAPLNTSDLPEIIAHPLLSERLDSIGVRYVVWVEGATQRTDSLGSMACSAGPTGAACFGFLSWEDDSFYEAAIWDIKSGAQVGKVSSDAVGTSYVPAVILPVPFLARVQNSACNSLAAQLKLFITNES